MRPSQFYHSQLRSCQDHKSPIFGSLSDSGIFSIQVGFSTKLIQRHIKARSGSVVGNTNRQASQESWQVLLKSATPFHWLQISDTALKAITVISLVVVATLYISQEYKV